MLLESSLARSHATRQWYEIHDCLTALGSFLIREYDFSAEDLQRYYETPWRFGREWNHYLKQEGEVS